jgi:hypothetical protein
METLIGIALGVVLVGGLLCGIIVLRHNLGILENIAEERRKRRTP